MKVLLTNDDGIDAPGIEALRQAVERMQLDYTIVAPVECHSGCSHKVTTHSPLRIDQRGEKSFAVHGAPADCIRVAVRHLQLHIDWVFAGINAGGNLGVDVFYSGTVAAVREAALFGIPGIAVSQYRRGPDSYWERSSAWTEEVLRQLLPIKLPFREFWNVNLPDPPVEASLAETSVENTDESGVREGSRGLPEKRVGAGRYAPAPINFDCHLDLQPLPVAYRDESDQLHYHGVYHQRDRDPGSDVDTCFAGAIAVCRLKL